MKATTKTNFAIVVLLIVAVSCLAGAVVLNGGAIAAQNDWYVCLSTQNYAVRNANKMTLTEHGYYILQNVSLSAANDFYITDNNGTRYYAVNDKPLSVEETAVCKYDIRFSPTEVYSDTATDLPDAENWAYTDCHITYRFNIPQQFSVKIGDTSVALTYNPFVSQYEEYYISSEHISAGTEVGMDGSGEKHTISSDGYYRILYTPDKVVNGNTYKFDADGNYGSGDDFAYNLYVEDAPQYYFAFKDNETEKTPLVRYEDNVSAAEYRTQKFFVAERDYVVKYCIYELVGDRYVLIDDDNDEDTDFSKLTATDAGWYTLGFVDAGSAYASSLHWQKSHFDGFYIVGEFNNFGYDDKGREDISAAYKFLLVEQEDEDYNEDYEQYVLYFSVTAEDLKDGDVEFYITNGDDKYKNGAEYISLNTAGQYKILFSEEHIYGRGRNYRYTLESEDKQQTELIISTVEQFFDFASNCSQSADYSVNLNVYIASDLDFAGKQFVSVKNFSGTLYGGYHTFKNITIHNSDGNAAAFETVTRTATIERLNVVNLSLDGEDYVGFVGKNFGTLKYVTVGGSVVGKNNVGGLCAYNGRSVNDDKASTTDSAEVLSYALLSECSADVSVKGQTNVGGLVGYNSGKITDCVSRGSVGGNKTSSSVKINNAGGSVGFSSGRLTDVTNRSAVLAGDDSRFVGGVCGAATGEVYFCFNYGNISATQYVGGICGYYGTFSENSGSSDVLGGIDYEQLLDQILNNGNETDTPQQPDTAVHKIQYAANFGNVVGVSYAGGIIGNSTVAGLKIYDCASVGDVEVTAGNYAGGIAGYAVQAEIRSCIGSGNVSAKGLNAGKYVGGIAGFADNVSYCMSASSVKGEDYVGGICGQASNILIGCYTNVLLIPANDAVNVGEIAGFCDAFNVSTNSFGDSVKGNYFVGEFGGIGKVNYGSEFGFAAAKAETDLLASEGALSPELCQDFAKERWQGGVGAVTYPTLIDFEQAEECTEFDDDALWSALFVKYTDLFTYLTRQNARITYTVVFLEWNKDNGELYDEGELQTENFEIINTVRICAGDGVSAPNLVFATLSGGKYVYDGDKARYFVSFPQIGTPQGNMTVYAVYDEIATSIECDGMILAEGEFVRGTVVKMEQVGEYTTLKFYLDGKELDVGNVTVKVKTAEPNNSSVIVLSGSTQNKVKHSVSGQFVSFEYNVGDYFKVVTDANAELPFWAWLLFGIGGTLVLTVIVVAITIVVKKKRVRKQTSNDEQISE